MSFTPDQLHVVTAITNPVRFRSRYALYRDFEKRVLDAGATLTVVEAAFGERNHELGDNPAVNHIRLRTSTEMWHKENLLNIGISRLPPQAKYIAWIDADVQFARADWAVETIQQLNHYQFVQMFSHAQDLGPDSEPLQSYTGFAYCYHQKLKGLPVSGQVAMLKSMDPYYGGTQGPYWHSGFAWAARREALDHVGGLIDFAVIGSADHHMAHAMIGNAKQSLPGPVTTRYAEHVFKWERQAERHIRRNIGYVPGLVNHYWHGRKKQRFYNERWSIINDNNFDPDRDLKRDSQGLFQLVDDGSLRSIAIRDQLRFYFRSRNEDGNEL